MSNFLYNFLKDKINDHPETEVIKNLPIYKTPYKNSPEFEERPYWFLHNKLKKKLYDCLPTLQDHIYGRPPPTWSELMNTPFPPGSSGDASLADSFRMLDEKVQIKQLRLWILGCLSAKNQTWQDFLNDRIDAASNLGVSSNGTGLGDILYNFEKKCKRDYNNKLRTAGPGALELARRQRGRRAEMGQLASAGFTLTRAECEELDRQHAEEMGQLASAGFTLTRAECEELDRQHAEEMARGEDELVARGDRFAAEEEMDAQRRPDFQNGVQGGRRRTKKKRKRRKKKRKKTRKKKRKKRRKKKRKKTRKKKLSENLTR